MPHSSPMNWIIISLIMFLMVLSISSILNMQMKTNQLKLLKKVNYNTKFSW